MQLPPDSSIISSNVQFALAEDIGSGDITAQLIPALRRANATVITREDAVLCGRPWAEEVFRQLDDRVVLNWNAADGDRINAGDALFTLEGPARSLLTGERAALNFVQLLSGTATRCAELAELVAGTPVKLLDTRKTLPGLRQAQKYAVRCGGCHNHRIGLFDAFLIKENHIAACGGIAAAIAAARKLAPGKPVEVEVESLAEYREALAAGPDTIMLDNFSAEDLEIAVSERPAAIKLEVSGGVEASELQRIAASGVDYISLGSLTKHVTAVDLSMRIND